MKTIRIAKANNNLSKLVHLAEAGEDIHLTRHGRPVAVLVSQARYQQMFRSRQAVFQGILRWRESHVIEGLTDQEVNRWRYRSSARDFSWD